MKIALGVFIGSLGVFIGFFICCVLFIVLAPNSVHEVIDRIHGNSSSNSGSSVVPQDDSGAGVIPSDEKPEPVEEKKVGTEGASLPALTDESKQTKRWYRSSAPIEGESIPAKKRYSTFAKERESTFAPPVGSDAPVEDASLPAPTDEPKQTKRRYRSSAPINESEMLDWLKANNYTVAEGQRFYSISWQNLKPVSPKPTGIVVNEDGTVVPQYGGHSVASRGSTASMGNNNTSTVSNNGITTTASTKYENGSWWIETIRSFVWNPRRDNIKDVSSKAKKIKEMNDEN